MIKQAALFLFILCNTVANTFAFSINTGDLPAAVTWTAAAGENINNALISTATTASALQEQDVSEITGLIISGKKQNNAFISIALLCADAGLTGLAAWNFIDYAVSAGSYNSMYAKDDNTTYANYLALNVKWNEAKKKENTFFITAGLAASALIFTFIDANYLHFVINDDISLGSGWRDTCMIYEMDVNFK
jgi:hypothetical protein